MTGYNVGTGPEVTINEYDRLKRIEKLAGELVGRVLSHRTLPRCPPCEAKARELQAEIQKGVK